MGPIAVHRLLRRARGRLAGLLAVLALAAVVVLHHAEMPAGAMGGMASGPGMVMGAAHDVTASAGDHHDAGAMAAMAVCLGALVALGVALAGFAVGVLPLGRWRLAAADGPASFVPPAGARRLPRAGPPGLPILQAWRI